MNYNEDNKILLTQESNREYSKTLLFISKFTFNLLFTFHLFLC